MKLQVFRIILRVYQSNTLIETITKGIDLNLKVEVPSISGTVIVSGKNQSLLGDKLLMQYKTFILQKLIYLLMQKMEQV